MVRARFLPSRKKVLYKVVQHTGSNALQNGHNHVIKSVPGIVSPPKLDDGEKKECTITDEAEIGEFGSIMKRMKDDPQSAASLMEGWNKQKRRRLCNIAFDRFPAVLSRARFCSTRKMVEALNVVSFMVESISENARTGAEERREGTSSSESREISRTSEPRSGAVTGFFKNTLEEREHSSNSNSKGEAELARKDGHSGVNISRRIEDCSKIVNESSVSRTRSCIIGRAVHMEGARSLYTYVQKYLRNPIPLELLFAL